MTEQTSVPNATASEQQQPQRSHSRRCRRVLYPLTSALIKASDALPSNAGRSSMVHSLAYAFDLLDFGQGGRQCQDEDESEGDDETTKLLRFLAGGDRLADHSSHDAKFNRAKVTTPPVATQSQFQSYHSTSYLSALFSSTSSAQDESYGLLDDCPRFSLLSSHVETLGGTILHAAQELASGNYDVAIVWDGGRHHAKKSKASGFCYINDAVLAIMELKRPRKVFTSQHDRHDVETVPTQTSLGFGSRPEHIAASSAAITSSNKRARQDTTSSTQFKRRTTLKRLSRILYLDLDLHWGDGVEEAFTSTTSVLTVSIHNSSLGFFPVPTENDTSHSHSHSHSLRVPLQPNLSSENFTRIFNTCILPLFEAYAPEAIVVQCGLDGLSEDPMNVWNLDLRAVLSAVEEVLHYADGHDNVPVLLLGGGGYSSPNAARGWTALTALALGRASTQTWAQDDGEQHTLCSHSAIPATSPHWPQYAPSYSLDVPAGHRVDTLHTHEYLSGIEATFTHHAKAIREERTRGRVAS